jgi:hypothetical protein
MQSAMDATAPQAGVAGWIKALSWVECIIHLRVSGALAKLGAAVSHKVARDHAFDYWL